MNYFEGQPSALSRQHASTSRDVIYSCRLKITLNPHAFAGLKGEEKKKTIRLFEVLFDMH